MLHKRSQMVNGVASVNSPLRLHVLGLAHVRSHPDYSYCAFTTLIRNFCRMMTRRGHEIIFYGVEGSEVDCAEFVTCLSDAEYLETYAENEEHLYQYKYRFEDGPAWERFNARAESELRARINGGREIVCVGAGGYHRFAQSIPGAILVDPHVGHKFPIAPYRVFPCKTWRAFYYGLMDEELRGQNYPPPYWGDAVIYHYLDFDDFPPIHEKDDYFAFVGRLNMDKGVYDAIRACAASEVKLKIAGAYSPDTKESFLAEVERHAPFIEYVGTVKARERAELMGRARGLICPTYYNEPFGMIAIEAQALGTPVIASDWGGFAETVAHGKTGLRCSYYADIERAVRRIRDAAGDLWMPSQIRRWAEDNFSFDAVGSYYERYFRRALTLDAHQGNFYAPELDEPIIQDLIDAG